MLGETIAAKEDQAATFGYVEARYFRQRFVGADRGLKRLALRRLSEIDLEPLDGAAPEGPRAPGTMTLRDALSLMMSEGADPLVVVGAEGQPIGQISVARVGRLLAEL